MGMIVMAPTPLVMRSLFGHSYDEATAVMMVHMTLMFAPSLVTGAFVKRFGTAPMMLCGCSLYVVVGLILVSGTTLVHFTVGLGVLGVGWNVLFLAGTAQLTKSYSPAE